MKVKLTKVIEVDIKVGTWLHSKCRLDAWRLVVAANPHSFDSLLFWGSTLKPMKVDYTGPNRFDNFPWDEWEAVNIDYVVTEGE